MKRRDSQCYAKGQADGRVWSCRKPVTATGLCGGHYSQRRRGLPFTPITRRAAHAN